MLFIAKFLANILKVLNSEVSPRQIAAGFAWGAVIGLLPVKGLMPYVLLILAFVVNVNLAMVSLATVLFKIISFLVDPLANQLGFQVLKMPSLNSFWTTLYNAPVVPFTRFNNTLVMGSLLIGLVLLFPLYLLAKFGVLNYRTQIRDKFLKFKIVQILKASSLYRYYEMVRGIRGE